MLFTQFEFIFYLLPFTLFLFYRKNFQLPALLIASIIFYSYWNYAFLPLLLISIALGYSCGFLIHNNKSRAYLIFVIGISLLPLLYFKYAGFITDNLGIKIAPDYISTILPLGISFYTFQQVAYLVEVYKGYAPERNFFRYSLFVSFFPQLIAGPILRPTQILPQLKNFKPSSRDFNAGLILFSIGFIKKVLIADQIGPQVDAIYAISDPLTFTQSFTAVVGFTLQIYFDFSGYCDMALGLARLFGIHLPINFNSPYKSRSIIEFWQRWHITLSEFFRDYVYIPLGGNRKGKFIQIANILFTMLLCGLWHGASWTFILWGGIHGLLAILNHFIRKFFTFSAWDSKLTNSLKVGFTFIIISLTWVIFRSPDVESGLRIYKGLLQQPTAFNVNGWILCGFVLLFFPNANEITDYFSARKLIEVKFIFNASKRAFIYVLVGMLPMAIFFHLFYGQTIDRKIYKVLAVNKMVDGIWTYEGDFRSKLLTRDILQTDAQKVLFVGSSFTRVMGNFEFKYDGQKFKSASLGVGGRHILNGFRTSMASIDTNNLNTIIFGISPLNIGPLVLRKYTIAWPKQCIQGLKELDPVVIRVDTTSSLSSCQSVEISHWNGLNFLLSPRDKRFFQLHNFFQIIYDHYIKTDDPNRNGKIENFELNADAKDLFYKNLKADIERSRQNPTPIPYPDKGLSKDYHWGENREFHHISTGGSIYRTFKKLKELADSRGVRLVVYNTPTSPHDSAPDIYPKGYLKEYSFLIQKMMTDLNIEYYNLLNFFPWDGAFMSDFVHPYIGNDINRRHQIHQHLLYQIFDSAKDKSKLKIAKVSE